MMKFKKSGGMLLGLAFLSLFGSITAAVQLSREDGDRLQRKIDEIVKNSAAPAAQSKKTPVSESEVNSYLAFNVRDKIPKGLTNPEIAIVGNGALAGRVLMDLDEFNRNRRSQGGLMDPLAYLSGKVPVTARGILRAEDGRGRFYLESAEIHGVNLPKPLVQEMVSYFSRTAENPGGFDIDAPFDLPAKIRAIVINKGEAIVAQ
ncbi:MAG TPA: hypothetical protein VGL70_19855 [Candidatus Binatia bacterium]